MKDSLQTLIFQKASVIASGAVVTDDPGELSKIAISMSLLAIASNLDQPGKAERLVNLANTIAK